MKIWNVTMWRSNPQLKNGGYETTVKIEARTSASAMKKADKKFNTPGGYGSYSPLRAEVA